MIHKLIIKIVNMCITSIIGIMNFFGLRLVNSRIAVVTLDDYILLVNTHYFTESVIPGGSVNTYNEQPIDAAIREMQEEVQITNTYTNMVISPTKDEITEAGCYLLGRHKIKHMHLFVWKVQANAKDLSLEVKDTLENKSAFWHSLAELGSIHITPDLKYFLQHELSEHIRTGRQFVRRWLDLPQQ